MGHDMLISSFVVIVIGGLGSLRGAVIVAALHGRVRAGPGRVLHNRDFAMVIVYMMMALILIFKPRGILGEGKFE